MFFFVLSVYHPARSFPRLLGFDNEVYGLTVLQLNDLSFWGTLPGVSEVLIQFLLPKYPKIGNDAC